jgi:hypothetical protein
MTRGIAESTPHASLTKCKIFFLFLKEQRRIAGILLEGEENKTQYTNRSDQRPAQSKTATSNPMGNKKNNSLNLTETH